VAIFDGVSDVHHDGEFGGLLSIPFEAASPDKITARGGMGGPTASLPSSSFPTPSPLNASTSSTGATPLPRASVRVEILYDYYPGETSWTIVDNTTGVQIDCSPAFSVTTPMELVTKSIPDLLAGQSYIVTIQDLAGDGVCCVYGEGSVQVVLVAPSGNESVVWGHRGDFGTAIEATVEVPIP
jgi:hypothetical protein